MSMKEFLEKNDHFKIIISHLRMYGGGFRIQLYNTTLDIFEPVFERYFLDSDISKLNMDFETIIMTPIINWLKDQGYALMEGITI